jgi:hypothetical protein
VRVELRDAASLERLQELWVEVLRERLDIGRLGAVAGLPDELLVAPGFEELVPGSLRCASDGHAD